MADFLLIFFTAVLIIISAFVVLVILMQKPSANAGLGSALGGGAAESAFGAQTGNILTKVTIYGCVAFFVCAFCLYLGFMGMNKEKQGTFTDLESELPAVVVPPVDPAEVTTGDDGTVISNVKVTKDGVTQEISSDMSSAPIDEAVKTVEEAIAPDAKPATVKSVEETKTPTTEK